jgi:hypothetical protein
MEASMKPILSRARPLVRTDLFDGVAASTPLANLQKHHNHLVELLSQLQWQVTSQVDVSERLEDDDEQDRPCTLGARRRRTRRQCTADQLRGARKRTVRRHSMQALAII